MPKNSLSGFGSNYLGMLGTGKKHYFDIAISSEYTMDFIQISAGDYHTLGLKADGTVWAWGSNRYGQLGNGTYIDSSIPVQVIAFLPENFPNYYLPLDNVIYISAGAIHSIALKADGTVWAWGDNRESQLGETFSSSELQYNYAVQVHSLIGAGFEDIIKIDAGTYHNLALKKDGTVFAWGSDDFCESQGPYCKDEYMSCHYPDIVSGISDVKDISAGYRYSIALKNDGSVWFWGAIGCEKIENPIRFENLKNIKKISAGDNHFLALDKDGSVWVWGSNRFGQLGEPLEVEFLEEPIKKDNIKDVKKIFSGPFGSLIVKNDGTVYIWGTCMGYLNSNGGCDIEINPVKINEILNPVDVSIGFNHQIFLLENGELFGRLDNYYGQLGIGEFGYEPSPVHTIAPLNLIQVDGGYLFSLGLKDDGTVWSWGYNAFGQLGIGKTKDELLYSLVPVQVQIENVKQISAGSEFGVALKEDGSVWTWGSNDENQLGDGSKNNSNVPIKIMENVKKIAAGNFHCLVIKEDGSVWQWGWPHSNKPEKVPNLSNVIAVSGGKEHSIALKEDGTVWAWGYNGEGQIGNGKKDDLNYYSTPQKVLNLENVVAISAGDYHNLAIKEDGSLWFWGERYEKNDTYGWINEKFEAVPIQIQNIPPISSASACNFFSLLVDFEGNLWSMGIGHDGQLGTGDSFSLLEEPVKIIDTKDVISSGCGSFHSFAIKKIGLKNFLIK
ncbi:MAG: hypothetical protein WHV67_00880 [Thermoanaerobaculia bacterium]